MNRIVRSFAWLGAGMGVGLGLPAWGMGLVRVPLPPVVPAPQQVEVDGRLDEWRTIPGYVCNPLGDIVKSGGNAEVDALLADPVSATVKLCYDASALYVAVAWRDRDAGRNRTAATTDGAARWEEGGEGFEIHLRAGKLLHLACWPIAAGKGMALMGRSDLNAPWKDFSAIVAGAGRTGGGKEYAQELRIPWSALTADGQAPADGKMDLGIDLAWNALPAALLPAVRAASVATQDVARGVPVCFLTSRPGLAGAGAVFDVANWGALLFDGQAEGGAATADALGNTILDVLPVAVASAPPGIDGSLEGWDPAAFRTSSYLGAFWGDRFTSRFAACFDAENLYLAARFASFGPMANAKPEATKAGFGGGDALQVRLSDGKKKVNLCGWYDSATGAPALTADGNDLPTPFILQEGAREAFRSDAGGRGYVQEIAVPWKLLFGQAPRAGERLQATLQPWFADLTPRFSLYAPVTLERQGVLAVPYKMPVDGELTLGLYDGAGKLLRWLVQDEFRPAGDQRQAWDGLDQWGKPVTPGSYFLKAIYHGPLSTDYVMTVANPGNPPWPTPDDRGDWLGDESTPQAAVTDGKWVYLAAPGSEKGFSIIAVDEAGQRQWGVGQGFNPRCVSLALDGDYLYVLFSGPFITDNKAEYDGKNAVGKALLLCLDKRTGKPARFTQGTPRKTVATWPYREEVSWLWDLRNNHGYTPGTYAGQPRYFCDDIGESDNALGMAMAGGKLYVSLFYEGKVIAVDPATGEPTGASIPVEAPVGLCAADDQTLLAVSGKQVVRIDVAAKTVTPFAGAPLVAPHSVTRDRDGNVYVSDWGTSFQVKVFGPDGKFLRAIGKQGGRPWAGKWDPSGMLVPRGVAVTDDGKLWVAEDDSVPKRVSVWDAKSGALLRDYVGPTPYGGGSVFWIDPKDPALVHAAGVRFRIDPAKKSYVPEATELRRIGLDDPFTPNGHAWGGPEPRVLWHDGKEYLFVENGGHQSSFRQMSILRRDGDTYRAVAAIGRVPKDRNAALNRDGASMFNWDSEIRHHVYDNWLPPFFHGRIGQDYVWADANGDNRAQAEEMQWAMPSDGPYAEGAVPGLNDAWGGTISDDWTYFFLGRFSDQTGVYRISPKGWSASGAPIYDLSQARLLFLEPNAHGIGGLLATRDNKLIVAYDYESWSHNVDGIACYDFDGKKLWSTAMPKQLEGKALYGTSPVYDFSVPGLGDVVGTWAWHGSYRPHLVTTDGLYVGTLLEKTLLGPKALWGESATYFYQAPDGTPYIINGGNQGDHILKIGGLDAKSVGRFDGTFTLTADDAAKAAALRQVPEVKAAPKPLLAISWLAKPPVIDGDLSDWNLAAGVTCAGEGGRGFDAALARDADTLYLAYRVREPDPLRNGGTDWQSLFATGDCVDLMLQTDPKAEPNRRNAVEGDLRLLFSQFQGKSVAVLYRPVVPGASAPVQLSSARIDQVVRLDSARVAMRRDAAHGGYTVEAAVPLRDLGIDPRGTDDLRGDVGAVFADETGRSRSQRLYYYNRHTEMINDIPTEATLQPGEWGAVILPLGANLLQNGGFEEPLVTARADMGKGWFVTAARNGSDAAPSAEAPYSGHASLLLETTVPTTFAPEQYDNPNYWDFRQSANGGKGGGLAEVAQEFPVLPGHLYSVRYRYRAQDMEPEHGKPGHPRGQVGFSARLDWIGVDPKEKPPVHYFPTVRDDAFDWQTVFNYRQWAVPAPYLAPPGATRARLTFTLLTQAEKRLPRVFLDNVEVVDVTP